MAVEYKCHIYNELGVRQREFNDFLAMEYMKQRNEVGYLRFELPEGHDIINLLDAGWQVKIQFKDDAYDIPWTTDFEGIFQSQRRYVDNRGVTNYTFWFATSLEWLTRSIVGYRANVNNRNSFDTEKPETIAKNIVKYNATSLGTTSDGRLRNVDGWGAYISVEADAASGTDMDYNCAWMNTLDAVQGVADMSDSDFDLVKTGALTWEFRWYNGGMGDDLSADLIFSLDRHNMEDPELEIYENLATVAIAAGEGEEADRKVSIQAHSSYASIHYAREMYVDARNYNTTAGLSALAANKLTQLQRGRFKVNFKMLQVPNALYRVHYTLGDWVGSNFQGYSSVKQIDKATVRLTARDQGGDRVENIDFELID